MTIKNIKHLLVTGAWCCAVAAVFTACNAGKQQPAASQQQSSNEQQGTDVQTTVEEGISTGVGVTLAEQFTVRDDKGKTFTLKDLSAGKKVVLVDFWASWCPPCRKEIPNVKAQYAKYKDKGFQVISISVDKDIDDWREALAEEKLEWPNFRDTEGAAALYHVQAIPAMFLVDAETQALIATGYDARGENLANKLAELFK